MEKQEIPVYIHPDTYHRLCNVVNHHSDGYVVKRAKSTLSGWQTAGGPNILRKEAEQILNETENWERKELKSLT